jgi:hypothetical protein
MPLNYTAADVLGSSESALLLALFLPIPGFVVGWITNVFRFRERTFLMRMVFSTPIAVAVMPVVVFLAGSHPRVMWSLFAAFWAVFAALMGKQLWTAHRPSLPREFWIAAALVLGWALLVILSLSDLQIGDRIYFSTSAYDHSVRSAFTAAAARAIPPANPFFAATPPVTLHYHYFWMLICSLPVHWAGLVPRHALYGGTVWAGIALLSMIIIGLEFFTCVKERLGRCALIGCGLLAVTGLDILPVLYLSHFKAPMYADPEWWNIQISSWVDGLLWAPHHIMAMLACLLGFLAMRQPGISKLGRATGIGIAGLAFASAGGLSALATFTFAVSLGFWVLLSAGRRWWDEVALALAAGAVAFVFAFPYLRTVILPGIEGAGEGGFLRLAVREFPLAMRMLARHTSLHIPPDVANFLLLPLNYFFELGFFLLVAVLRLRDALSKRIEVTREELAAWTMVGSSFLIGSFLRSTSLSSNDLGWRCFIQAQFLFLLWAVLLLDDWSKGGAAAGMQHGRGIRKFARAMLILGVLGTVYQVIDLRVYTLLYDWGTIAKPANWLAEDRQLGRRTFALRSVYQALTESLPRNAVVQYNPLTPAYIPHLLYSGHDAAIGLPGCAAGFGGDPATCGRRVDTIIPLFTHPSPQEASRLDEICREFGISILLVTDSDPAWTEPESWVWKRTPYLANQFVRAFRFADPPR